MENKIDSRKDNTYFDQRGKQILIGDLLKVYHFGIGNRTQYMYHIVVMEETKDFPVMAIRGYYEDKPHCRMCVLANNEQRVYKDAKVISEKDWQTKRIRIKIIKSK